MMAHSQDTKPDSRHAVGDEVRLPLVQEQLLVEKRAVETGRVRIRKAVEQEKRIVDAPLMRDEIDVRRIPVGRVVERTEPPREADGLTIIPIYEEVLVVEKRLVLKEELHIRQRRVERREPVEVTLRREQAIVEREDIRPGDETNR